MTLRTPPHTERDTRTVRALLDALREPECGPPMSFPHRVMSRVQREQRASAPRRVFERMFENVVFPLYLMFVCSFLFWMMIGLSLPVLIAQLTQSNLGVLVFVVLAFTGVLSLIMGLARNRPFVLVGTASLTLAAMTLLFHTHV